MKKIYLNGKVNFFNKDKEGLISKKWFNSANDFVNGFAIVEINNPIYSFFKKIYNKIDRLILNLDSVFSYILIVVMSTIFFSPIVVILYIFGFDLNSNSGLFSVFYTIYFISLLKLSSYFEENKYIIDENGKIINKKGFKYISDFNANGRACIGREYKFLINDYLNNYIDKNGNTGLIWYKRIENMKNGYSLILTESGYNYIDNDYNFLFKEFEINIVKIKEKFTLYLTKNGLL